MRKYEDAIGWLSFVIGCLLWLIIVAAGWVNSNKWYEIMFFCIAVIGLTTVYTIHLTMWLIRKHEKGEDMAEILEKLEPRVQAVLEDHEDARGDDAVLYARYIERFRPDLSDVPATTLFKHHKDYEVPSYESVTRIRRMVQTKHAELLPTEKTRQKREKAEQDYKDYARQG